MSPLTMFAAQSGMNLLSGLLGGGQDYSQVDAHNREVARQNKRVVEANLENTVRTGMRVGILNMQQGLAKQRMAQAGYLARAEGQALSSSNAANAAASGNVGASVQAVAADVTQKIGEAEQSLAVDWQLQQLNFNTELSSLVDSGKASLQGAVGTVQKVRTESFGSRLLGAAAQTGLSMAGSFFQSKINLGLGKSPAMGVGQGLSVGGTAGTGLKLGGGQGLRL